ncbi:tetratricopeptide repeat protein [Candidatus Heimdallarchaeota archaeon]|nr:MAG: tetratricopeptide repeat protein [Candidatus Heimdallarchaeota archaeon]
MVQKQFVKIKALIREEEFKEALKQLDILKWNENDPQAFYQLQTLKGKIYIKMEEQEKCFQLTQQLLFDSDELRPREIIQILNLKAEAQQDLGQYQEALETIKEAEKLFKKIKEKDELKEEIQAKILSLKGLIYLKKGGFEKAHAFLEKSLELYQKINDKEELSSVLNYLGGISLHKGELDEALDYFQQSLKIRRKLGSKTLISGSLNNIAVIYYYKSELDKALECLLEALTLAKEMKKNYSIGNAYNNIGNVHLKKGELNQALESYKKALKSFKQLDSKDGMAINSINIGIVYERKGEFEEALKFLEWSLEIFQEIGNTRYMADALQSIGAIHQKKGKLKQAVKTFKKALTLQNEIENTIVASYTMLQLLNVEIERGEIEEAKKYLEEIKGIQIEEENKEIELYCSLGEAMILKEEKMEQELSFKSLHRQMKNIVEAKRKFESIVNKEEIVDYELTVEAINHLCELDILEASTFGSKKPLERVYRLTEKLVAIAKKQNSYSLLAKTFLLQAHLVALDSKTKQAKDLLRKAEQIADEKGYDRLAIVIVNELKRLEGEVFEAFNEKEVNFLERLGKLQLQGLMTSIRQKRVEFYSGNAAQQPTISALENFSKELRNRNIKW